MARILIFDSGLGGLSVCRTIMSVMSPLDIVYVADCKGFPYGNWEENALNEHIIDLMGHLIEEFAPDIVVLASSSASTLSLGNLKALFPTTVFVGTPTAMRHACEMSKSGMISVLASPGAARRGFRAGQIEKMAQGKDVSIVPTRQMAELVEAWLHGRPLDLEAIRKEIMPAFIDDDGHKTDTIVLGCTHYPLIMKHLKALAPWEVNWIDPSPIIAKRVYNALDEKITGQGLRMAYHTGNNTSAGLQKVFSFFRFGKVEALGCPDEINDKVMPE